MKKIKNLEPYGNYGWTWKELDPIMEKYRLYRTDKDGEGLWIWDPRKKDWKQVLGYTQFELKDDYHKAYSKIYREYNKNYPY